MKVISPTLIAPAADQLGASTSEQTDIDFQLSYNSGIKLERVEMHFEVPATQNQDVLSALTTNLQQGAMSFTTIMQDTNVIAIARWGGLTETSGAHQGPGIVSWDFTNQELVFLQNLRWARTNGTANVNDMAIRIYYRLVQLSDAELVGLVGRRRA